MKTLFINQLTTLDFSYFCVQRGLVGETWIVDIRLSGHLNEEGFLMDFAAIKTQLKKTLDDLLDHKLLVPKLSDAVACCTKNGQSTVCLDTLLGIFECTAPENAIVLLPMSAITAEHTVRWLIPQLQCLLSKNIGTITLNLYPEDIHGAYYHYSHGLKKHQGNCQRIAHGHRSPLAIFLDGKRAPNEEKRWTTLWRDIYIATHEDVVSQGTERGQKYITVAYVASQGHFQLTLPQTRCYVMDLDTTIEQLSHYVCETLRKKYPEKKIEVWLYEGFNKGAVSMHDTPHAAGNGAM